MVTLQQVQNTIGMELEAMTYTYSTRDLCLYALGVGAPANWLDQDELKFVYEMSQQGFVALPTFPVIFTSEMINVLISGKIGEIEFNPMMLVHGEQSLEIKKTIPTSGTITSQPRVTAIYDKGSGMLMVTEVTSRDENNDVISVASSSMFIRGLGDFGGDRGPSSKVNVPPEREPDVIHKEKTLQTQALIYRLSGDVNPLHADPAMAAVGNFETPILHGLSTFGFGARAVLKHMAGNDPARFKAIQVRFSKHVFPGETLITRMWREGDHDVIFEMKAEERDAVVLSNARIVLN